MLGQTRSTQRRNQNPGAEEARLRTDIIYLATKFGRYGYRRIAAMLKSEGWRVNHKRVERIWRQEGLKVPQKQPRRKRLWLNENSCIRLRPEHKDHVWSYDFVKCRTENGKAFRILTIIDEFTRECPALLVARSIPSNDVIDQLFQLFVLRGIPEHLRSDNGTESFNGKLRDELLNREIFSTLTEAKVLIEQWRKEYNQIRPHSSLGYRPMAPEAMMATT